MGGGSRNSKFLKEHNLCSRAGSSGGVGKVWVKTKKTCVGEGNGYILEQNNKSFELSYHSFKNGILNSLCHCWEELLARFCVNFTLHISKRCCKILTNVMEWQQY